MACLDVKHYVINHVFFRLYSVSNDFFTFFFSLISGVAGLAYENTQEIIRVWDARKRRRKKVRKWHMESGFYSIFLFQDLVYMDLKTTKLHVNTSGDTNRYTKNFLSLFLSPVFLLTSNKERSSEKTFTNLIFPLFFFFVSIKVIFVIAFTSLSIFFSVSRAKFENIINKPIIVQIIFTLILSLKFLCMTLIYCRWKLVIQLEKYFWKVTEAAQINNKWVIFRFAYILETRWKRSVETHCKEVKEGKGICNNKYYYYYKNFISVRLSKQRCSINNRLNSVFHIFFFELFTLEIYITFHFKKNHFIY